MIRTREEARAEAEAEAQEFSELIESAQSDTSGIPTPPQIDVSESILEPNIFDFELGVQPTAESFPGGEPPPPCEDCGACCIDDFCFQTTQENCVNSGGTFKGGPCLPSTCDGCTCCCDISGLGQTAYYCYVSDSAACPEIQGEYTCAWCAFLSCFDDTGDSTCEPGGCCCYFDEINMEWQQALVKKSICDELGGTFAGNHVRCDDPGVPSCP